MVSLDTYLKSLGQDVYALASEYGLMLGPRESWQDYFFSLSEYALFLEHLASKLKDPYFALSWSLSFSSGGLRALYLATRYAPTPYEALQITEKYRGLGIDLDECHVEVEGERVVFSWAFSPLIVRCTQMNDRFAAVVAGRFDSSFFDRSVRATRLDLMRPTPASPVQHRRLFGANVFFDQPANRLFFPRVGMMRANPSYDPELYEVLVELCERRSMEGQETTDLVQFVRTMILSDLSATDMTIERAAREFGMSPRVFQRRLAENGTTFQELYDQTRKDMAQELLANTALPISEIAIRLGFSATGNFTRAAKRWFGVPPNTWRRASQEDLVC